MNTSNSDEFSLSRNEIILKRRSKILANRRKLVETEHLSPVLTFKIGSTYYAVRISQLIGIRDEKNMRLLPGPFHEVHGILNVHGEVYSVFVMPGEPTERRASVEKNSGYILLLSSKNHLRVGLQVDELGTVVQVKDEEITHLKLDEFKISCKYLTLEGTTPFLFFDVNSLLIALRL